MDPERVLAEGLIYTRVEAPFSPTGRSGFQTVWKTAGLSSAQVAEVERRVRFFDSTGHCRLQWTELEAGGFLVARTRTIEPHGEINDQPRRAGCFMVQCLVVDSSQISSANKNPFALVAVDPFDWSMEGLVARLGVATGEMPKIQLTIDSSSARPHRKPWIDLVKSALAVDRGGTGTLGLVLIGDSDEIETVLETLFAFLPAAQRARCSFDTWAEQTPTTGSGFWAIGARHRPRSSGSTIVDIESEQVVETGGVGQQGMFLEWLAQASQRYEAPAIAAQVETVSYLSRALCGDAAGTPRDGLDPTAIDDLVRWQRRRFAERLRNVVAGSLNDRLAEVLTNRILRDPGSADDLMTFLAGAPEARSAIAVHARSLLDQDGVHLSRADLKVVARLGRNARDWVLLHAAASLRDPPALRDVNDALRWMTTQEFEVALMRLQNPIAPALYVNENHLNALFQQLQPEAIDEPELLALAVELAKVGASEKLELLSSVASKMSSGGLRRYERLRERARSQHTSRRAPSRWKFWRRKQ